MLRKSDELRIVDKSSSPDLVIVWTDIWNRATFLQTQKLGLLPPVLVLCNDVQERFARESTLHREIAGVLRCDSVTGDQVIAAIQAASSGLRVTQASTTETIHDSAAYLTPRELEILGLIADGEGNKSIAYLLKISEHTVKFHISSIFEKLHVSSRTEAVKSGVKRGLISI